MMTPSNTGADDEVIDTSNGAVAVLLAAWAHACAGGTISSVRVTCTGAVPRVESPVLNESHADGSASVPLYE